jgi:hypothetical protein
MNERIFDMAKELLPNQKEFFVGDPKDWGYFFSRDELEKFAELIIKECTKLIEHSIEDDEYWSRITGAESIMAIEEHFGVEE